MKLTRTSGTLILATLAVITSPFAVAEDSGGYFGINVGQSRANIDDERITGNLLGRGFTGVTIADDDRDTGYKLYGGYRFNRNFAVEGGFFDLGKFGFTATTVPAGTLSGNIKIRGVNLDAVGILPITEKFSALGRIGVNYAQAKDHFTGTGAVTVTNPDPKKSDTNYKFGVGLQYDFTETLGVRVEAERYRINDAVGNRGDVDLISVGLVYRFGGKTQSAAPRAAAPEPVAAAPAPQPAPARVAAAPAPTPAPAPAARRVTFSTDSLFDFDRATLKPAGKRSLDKFAVELMGVDYDVIAVTGHTDRLGSDAYNMKLSTRRAEAVKSYLVLTAAIPAGKIEARGAGESEPVTKPDQCQGNKATRELIACLQPDRRVEGKVSGTK
jgi:OOP family OmpA-OmpF porin